MAHQQQQQRELLEAVLNDIEEQLSDEPGLREELSKAKEGLCSASCTELLQAYSCLADTATPTTTTTSTSTTTASASTKPVSSNSLHLVEQLRTGFGGSSASVNTRASDKVEALIQLLGSPHFQVC